jgi:hypothetical protein
MIPDCLHSSKASKRTINEAGLVHFMNKSIKTDRMGLGDPVFALSYLLSRSEGIAFTKNISCLRRLAMTLSAV